MRGSAAIVLSCFLLAVIGCERTREHPASEQGSQAALQSDVSLGLAPGEGTVGAPPGGEPTTAATPDPGVTTIAEPPVTLPEPTAGMTGGPLPELTCAALIADLGSPDYNTRIATRTKWAELFWKSDADAKFAGDCIVELRNRLNDPMQVFPNRAELISGVTVIERSATIEHAGDVSPMLKPFATEIADLALAWMRANPCDPTLAASKAIYEKVDEQAVPGGKTPADVATPLLTALGYTVVAGVLADASEFKLSKGNVTYFANVFETAGKIYGARLTVAEKGADVMTLDRDYSKLNSVKAYYAAAGQESLSFPFPFRFKNNGIGVGDPEAIVTANGLFPDFMADGAKICVKIRRKFFSAAALETAAFSALKCETAGFDKFAAKIKSLMSADLVAYPKSEKCKLAFP